MNTGMPLLGWLFLLYSCVLLWLNKIKKGEETANVHWYNQTYLLKTRYLEVSLIEEALGNASPIRVRASTHPGKDLHLTLV